MSKLKDIREERSKLTKLQKETRSKHYDDFRIQIGISFILSALFSKALRSWMNKHKAGVQ